jgi:hypothetical protein
MPKKEQAPEEGIVFPTDKKGTRSTSSAGKAIIGAALKGASAGSKAAEKCEKEKNWRFGYHKHFMQLVKLQCGDSKDSVAVAKAGLAYMHDNFEFVPKGGGESIPLSKAMSTIKDSFKTATVKGTGDKKGRKLQIPFDGAWTNSHCKAPPAGAVLEGAGLKDQVNQWVENGVIESDAATAINAVSDHIEGGADLSDVYVVMIGAGSAMGPFSKLLELGANVIALDIPGAWGKGGKRPASGLWKRLTDTAKASPGGSIIFPVSKAQEECADDMELFESAGADLMKQPAECKNWLLEVAKTLPKGAKLCIGNYTYLDGALHVKLALAADVIIDALRKDFPQTSVAFLCTPTDIHVCPEEANQAAEKNWGGPIEMLINFLTMGTKLRKNALPPLISASGKRICLIDGLSVAQGPNYALAKRMQHWRAQVAFEEGATVSSMIAPSTATISVIHNKTFAWAYGGMPYFKPFEIFKQETTNAVMASLLLYNVCFNDGPKCPANRSKYGIENSIELFKTQGVHGGLWRAGYQIDSIGETSALVYFMGGPKFFAPVFYTLFTLVIYFIYKGIFA